MLACNGIFAPCNNSCTQNVYVLIRELALEEGAQAACAMLLSNKQIYLLARVNLRRVTIAALKMLAF